MIIGITGTNGAGKGTVVELLVKKGFIHFSVRAFLISELIIRGLASSRDNMRIVANELRMKYGPSYIAEQLYGLARQSGGNSVIESLRVPGEVESLRKKGEFYLIAVDAPLKIRYERCVKRASETDAISYDKFLENEKSEMFSKDSNNQNLSACITMADFKLENNGTISDLNQQVEALYNKITNA